MTIINFLSPAGASTGDGDGGVATRELGPQAQSDLGRASSPARPPLTANRLRELVVYDPETGRFTWTIGRGNRVIQGALAGGTQKFGYWYIGVEFRHYPAHRLAWLYMTGEWPTGDIDHKDTDTGNNRWSNLRLATTQQNQRNRRLNKNNTSGFKGVTWDIQTNKWRVKILISGRTVHLGRFSDVNEAGAAYAEACRQYFGEFGRIK